MDSFLRLKIQYSTSHLFFPKIVVGFLVFLAACIAVRKVVLSIRTGQPLFNREFKFFIPGADFFMLTGSLVLFILYAWLMKIIGFLASSLIFIFLFNVLFCRTLKIKSLIVSLVCTTITCFATWYLFAVVFNISLP